MLHGAFIMSYYYYYYYYHHYYIIIIVIIIIIILYYFMVEYNTKSICWYNFQKYLFTLLHYHLFITHFTHYIQNNTIHIYKNRRPLINYDFMTNEWTSQIVHSRALRQTVFFTPLWISDHYRPHPQHVCYTPARSPKTLRIYAHTIIEMHWFCVFSRPARENTSFYRLLIKRFMDNWETSPNVRLALVCLCAVKTFLSTSFIDILLLGYIPIPQCFFFLAARSRETLTRRDPIPMQPSTTVPTHRHGFIH